MLSRLSVSVIVPEHSAWGATELRLLVDDQDLLEPVFDKGPWRDPDQLLGPDSPLLPTNEPREVMLAEAECTWGCCGAIFVRIRREANAVVWDQWRNPVEGGPEIPEVRFDAAQYETALAQAHADRGWEWHGRTVARLVDARLRKESTVLGQWDSSLDFVNSLLDTQNLVCVAFTSPPRHVVNDHWQEHGRMMEHDQFLMRFPVGNEPAELQAEHIIAMLNVGDPRKSAEICGGYTERST